MNVTGSMGETARRLTLALILLGSGFGCTQARVGPQSPAGSTRARLGHAALLACLGAPPETLYQPERLDGTPVPGLAVHTFDQQTASCGIVERRYLSYVPGAVGARTTAPVVLVLHGQGASAETMMTFQARGTFNHLADKEGFVVVYGNGLPTSFNFAGLPNSGRWRSEYTDVGSTIDELAYLRLILEDLTGRGAIAGGNDVYLVGQSNGGGLALSAARQRPYAYAGVAAFMPFVGFSPVPPESLAGARLRHVMFAYSVADPALPPGYAAEVLAPLARGWARALGIPDRDIESPAATTLGDIVKEGQGDRENGHEDATCDSTVTRLDLRSPNGALRQLVFDHAGHFWPTRVHSDPPALLSEFGLRNQDIEGTEEIWRFFRQ